MRSFRQRVRERLTGRRLDPVTEAEVVDELTQHVEERYQELRTRGVREEDAVIQAWKELEGHPRLSRDISKSRRALPPAPVHDTSRSGVSALRAEHSGRVFLRARRAYQREHAAGH